MSLNSARKNISGYRTQKRVTFLHGLYFVSQRGFEESKQTTQAGHSAPTQRPPPWCHSNLPSTQRAK